ncbi:RNA-directed DNA polymerase from mobile element jockey [Eumeta japonica]|uniref:RNA-directed DNA polymerase from mobile element jockey n=1 Tax=Eumeta variegata TaxID=151549 RepID=A0A4C2A8Z9_EUMVA|nr:RNA-directed DNA polymerase from mobile element jockey [Eumeta japonica]
MSEAPGCSNHSSAGRLKPKPQITLVQCTWINQQYSRVRYRLGTSGGGTVLYYKRSLHCCPVDTPQLINLEVTACKLAMSGHGTLIIVSVYLPSSKQLLRSDLESLLALGEHVILFEPDNTLAFEDREKAECLANSIERQCSHLPMILYTSRIGKKFVRKSPRSERRSGPSHVRRGQRTRQNLKTRKAPGLDGISNKAIKCFSSPLLALLVAIFNACLKIVTFRSMERCRYHRHSKTGETTRPPHSYRPISLLSSLGKLYENSQVATK